jgi:hypothetical protein
MISRRLIVCFALFAPLTAAQAQEAWTSYHNPRFGTAIDYPARFRPGRPPDNNDGLSFTAPDGATLRVWGSLNVLEHDVAGLETFLRESEEGARITYRAAARNWLVLSGTRADHIFYQRHVFSHRNEVVNAFEISYPAKLAAVYDPIVARMAKSLRPGRGYQIDRAP